MRRLKGERGASAVLVALVLVVLIAFVAMAVDLGAGFVDRTQQQNGADAAALGIAQECAAGRMACSDGVSADHTALAQQLAFGNKVDGNATATVTALTTTGTGGSVTVRVDSVRQNWFAGVIGIPTTDVAAQATAVWGPGGSAGIPLAISWCSFKEQTGGWDATTGLPDNTAELVVYMTKGLKHTGSDVNEACNVPNSGNEVPGGFGWLEVAAGCTVVIPASGIVNSDPGNSAPCSGDEIARIKDKTVLVPIFDEADGTGNNAWYHVVGTAAFHVTAYNLGNNRYQYNCGAPNPGCGGSSHWIKGRFVQYLASTTPTGGGGGSVDLGVRVVRLAA